LGRGYADLLALEPQEWEVRAPVGFAFLAIETFHLGIAVVIAGDPPFEAEGNQRWRLNGEFARGGGVLR
jgi:hypothetical protein